MRTQLQSPEFQGGTGVGTMTIAMLAPCGSDCMFRDISKCACATYAETPQDQTYPGDTLLVHRNRCFALKLKGQLINKYSERMFLSLMVFGMCA